MPAMPILDIPYQIRRAISFALAILVVLGIVNGQCGAQSSNVTPCRNSTVEDAWGAEFASEAKNFFLVLQTVIKQGDKRRFATLVQYPLHVYGEKGGYEITTPAEMIRKYPLIFTAESQRAILAQSRDCLFGNGQGVMAAGGRIWFQKQPDGKIRVITLNVISSK